MKCPNCGAQMGLEDRFCPYCGSPNQQAVKHQSDMDRFKGEYFETKEHVLRRTEFFRNQGGLLIILALVLLAMIIGVILNAKAWDIGFSIREKSVVKYREVDAEVLEGYLQEGEYSKFVGYFDSNRLRFMDDTTYDAVDTVASAYVRLFEYVSGIDNPEDFQFSESRIVDSCQYLAEDLIRIYTVEKEYNYRREEYLTEDKLGYIKDIQERSAVICKTYFGLTDEEIADIPNMSESKLASLLEEEIIG